MLSLIILSVLFNNNVFAQEAGSMPPLRHNAAFEAPEISWEDYLAWMLPEHGTDYYDRVMAVKSIEMQQLKTAQEAEGISAEVRQVTIPKSTQSNGYNCVPAAVQNVVYGIKRNSPFQPVLAEGMWTNSTMGTSASEAAEEMRNQTGFNYQVGVVSEQPFYNHIKTSIIAGRPVILLVRYSSYTSGKADYGHALVCYGYNGSDDTFLCFDVLDGTSRWDSVETLTEATFYYIF